MDQTRGLTDGMRPDLWTGVLEELQELGNHEVERSIEAVGVQDLA